LKYPKPKPLKATFMQQLTRGIYYENDYPGVTLGALILPQGTLLIDAPLRSEDARAWRNALFSMGSSSRRLLVNLDSHTDRTLGARAMECTIIAHQKTAQVFRGRPSVFKGHNAESGSEWETQNDAVGTRWAVPDITFSESISLHWGKMEVRIEHHPGPAAGAIWVCVPEENIIFVGDAVVSNQPAFLTNADIPVWIETLNLLAKDYSNYVIISGRGGPLSFKEVQRQQQHLQHIQTSLDKLLSAHAPAEEIEKFIPDLLSDFKFPAHLREQFTQRLRHGLIQYYENHLSPSADAETA
jgi:glyoxylase-like metal-dependent hydrolase (beta-lactamase superfamily II)